MLDAFDEEFRGRIIKAADQNTRRNDERSGYLHWSRVALFAVLWLTALAGIPFVADQVRYSDARNRTAIEAASNYTTPAVPGKL